MKPISGILARGVELTPSGPLTGGTHGGSWAAISNYLKQRSFENW